MAVFTTLGMGAIASALEEAAPFYACSGQYHKFYSKTKFNIGSNALAFIQGTGLDLVIKVYDLDYDPQVLRNTFFRIFHVKQSA